MALQTKVGSFNKIGTTGTQAITGIGFTPKVIIFWTTQVTGFTFGTWSAGYSQSIGMTTGPSNSYCCQTTADDALTTSSNARRAAAKAIAATNNVASGLRFEADLQSFDADGFTLNWTNNAGGGNDIIMYMALGGSDITNATIIPWTGAGANGVQSVTGIGFKPDLVFHMANGMAVNTSGTTHRIIFGAMNKHGQQWATSTTVATGANPSDAARFQQTDACYSAPATDGSTIHGQAHYVSMDSDGFSIYWSTFIGAPAFSLCIKGLSSRLDAFPKPNTGAPATQQITKTGFQPRSVLFLNQDNSASTSPLSQASWGMGATDGITSRAGHLFDLDNVTPTKAKAVSLNDRATTGSIGVGATTITASAALASLDSDGFTLNWNPNDTGTTEILYMALGDATVNTYPTTIRSDSTNIPTTATGYFNQRKIDRCQNGVLWSAYDYAGTAVANGAAQLRYSLDNGATWVDAGFVMNASGGTAQTYVRNCSIFIDLDDYMHVAFKDNFDGLVYYVRGTPNAGRTSYTFSAAQRCTSNSGSGFNYPDLVAHREGTGWTVHILMGFSDTTPGNGTYCTRFTITSGGTITRTNDADTLNSPSYPGYAINVNTYPSIDFNHTGDGKTVAGGTPHLYAGWSAGRTGAGYGIRFKKATYSGGAWTWGTEREIDNTRQWGGDGGSWGVCVFDGTRVTIATETNSGGWNTVIYERDAADTATTTRTLVSSDSSTINGGLYNGSATYDSSGNIYLIGGDWDGTKLRVRVFNRGSLTLGSPIYVGSITGAGNYPTFKRGNSFGRAEWLWTAGNNSPYAVKYDNIVTTPIGLFIKRVKSITDLYREKMKARGFNI
jgi:hypothetical protein